jgi:hypothetical protein
MSGAEILLPLCVYMTQRATNRLPKLRLFFKFHCVLNIVGHCLEVCNSQEVLDANPDPKACRNSVGYALIIIRRYAVWVTYTHLFYSGTFTDHLATLSLNRIVQLDVFLTVHHSINLFLFTNLMHNSFIL